MTRIYILGVGNVGKLLAHAIKTLPEQPDVTLLMHSKSLVEAWESGGKSVVVQNQDGIERSTGYDVELVQPDSHISSTRTPIRHLFVATKTFATSSALESVQGRISSETRIYFFQNGIGTVDEVRERMFPDVYTAPLLFQGILFHGTQRESLATAREDRRHDFTVKHSSHGYLIVGLCNARLKHATHQHHNDGEAVSRSRETDRRVLDDDALQMLQRCPRLNTVIVSADELRVVQLEKLAVNAIINPLTAITDAPCGIFMAQRSCVSQIVRRIVEEVSTILCALPEVADHSDVAARFGIDRLEALVYKTAKACGVNFVSSMLDDVRAGRQTEIWHINGFLLRQAEDLNIPCPVNCTLVQLVEAKTAKPKQLLYK
ncbi:hypothetical protein AC579_5171 [Pseudocercospora musae]|uniref:2-dehydropantoate 2-reductase n=1 Tax=Pseudocercospora musae TaxID=113226 RepID=A0A139I8D4_9PEZI|nr:hypothetical protein AC579_5171 [Pseudocercospora musae]